MKWSKKRIITTLVFLPVFAVIVMFIGIGVVATRTSLCQNCRGNYQTADALPDVGFAELNQYPEKYAGQLIRLHAIFDHDAAYTFLCAPVPRARTNCIPVGFGTGFETCSSTKRALTIHTGLGTWYDGTTYVTVIGKYGIIDDQRKFQDGETGFTVFCLEKVEPINPMRDAPINAIRFGITQIGQLLF
jgi:hypothetical protein